MSTTAEEVAIETPLDNQFIRQEHYSRIDHQECVLNKNNVRSTIYHERSQRKWFTMMKVIHKAVASANEVAWILLLS